MSHPETTTAPSDTPASLFKQGLRLMYAGIPHTDIPRAVSLFQQAWQAGDPNAGYMLCHAYMDGSGVPRDYEQVRALAEKLADMQYYPAYFFLSRLYAGGYRVELNKAKSDHYTAELDKHCSTPLDGVDEILRYDALISSLLYRDHPDYRKIENLARENFLISDLPNRHSCLALSFTQIFSLLGEDSPTILQELRDAISAGIAEGDRSSYFLKILLLTRTDVYPEAENDEATELLRHICKIAPEDAETWLHLLSRTEPEEEREKMARRFWEICNYGVFRMKRENDLNCFISLAPAGCAAQWHILPYETVQEALQQEKIFDLCQPHEPLIILENKSQRTLSNLKLRVCSPDIDSDRTVDIPNVLAPGETAALPLAADYNLCLGKELTIEVSSGDQYSIMKPENADGVDAFRKSIPPLIMWWELGALGGYVLVIQNTGDEEINDIQIAKRRDESYIDCKPFDLQPGQMRKIGWMEFSDHKNLKADEEIFVLLQGILWLNATITCPPEQAPAEPEQNA